MSSTPQHVLIIGSGVIGAMTAHQLMLSGLKVTLVDKGSYGQSCSNGNCGYICPSHSLPLTAPGAWKTVLPLMLKRNPTFWIRPRLDPAMWRWMLAFQSHCNQKDMMKSAHALAPLLQTSRELYNSLMKRPGFDCEWETKGILFVHQTEKSLNHFAHESEMIAENFGQPSHKLDAGALLELEPALKPGAAAGAWLFPQDAHLRPEALLASIKKDLIHGGARIIENKALQSFETKDSKAISAKIGEENIAADAFVLATGAQTPLLKNILGKRLPIEPGKGYSITYKQVENTPKMSMIFEQHRVAVTPWKSGVRIGSMMEFVGYDDSIKDRRIKALTEGANHYFKTPISGEEEYRWFGWRPMTNDGLPFIDFLPGMSNVLVNAGHNMLGLSTATGSAVLAADLLLERKPIIDPTPYTLAQRI